MNFLSGFKGAVGEVVSVKMTATNAALGTGTYY